jgi:hypothetical protein
MTLENTLAPFMDIYGIPVSQSPWQALSGKAEPGLPLFPLIVRAAWRLRLPSVSSAITKSLENTLWTLLLLIRPRILLDAVMVGSTAIANTQDVNAFILMVETEVGCHRTSAESLYLCVVFYELLAMMAVVTHLNRFCNTFFTLSLIHGSIAHFIDLSLSTKVIF